MERSLKARWLRALRSGKYAQGKSFLRTKDNKYCCLGVLCDIAQVPQEEGTIGSDVFDFMFEDKTSYSFPSGPFLDQVELKTFIANELATKNDEGMKFRDIARVIRYSVSTYNKR